MKNKMMVIVFAIVVAVCGGVIETQAMPPGTFAIAAHGAGAEGAFDGWAKKTAGAQKWRSASTGDEFLTRLEDFCKNNDIGRLSIFSHGWTPAGGPGATFPGLVFKDDKGFYINKVGYDEEAADLSDLQAKITEGKIRFAPGSIIWMNGCRVGCGDFAKRLSKITGGTVYAATGSCGPQVINGQETGLFSSSASPWGKWVNGVKIINPNKTDDYLTTPNNLGTNYLKFWDLGPTVRTCDVDGREKNHFCSGEKVHVNAFGLAPTTLYKIWIQDDPVGEGNTLVGGENPNTALTPRSITTDVNGNFAPLMVWSIPKNAPVTYHKYDIVIDKQGDGANTGKYNKASDGIDSASVVGFVAPIPEFSTIAIPAGATLLLVFLISRRKQKR